MKSKKKAVIWSAVAMVFIIGLLGAVGTDQSTVHMAIWYLELFLFGVMAGSYL